MLKNSTYLTEKWVIYSSLLCILFFSWATCTLPWSWGNILECLLFQWSLWSSYLEPLQLKQTKEYNKKKKIKSYLFQATQNYLQRSKLWVHQMWTCGSFFFSPFFARNRQTSSPAQQRIKIYFSIQLIKILILLYQ